MNKEVNYYDRFREIAKIGLKENPLDLYYINLKKELADLDEGKPIVKGGIIDNVLKIEATLKERGL